MRGNVNVGGAEVSVTYEPTGATKTTIASDNGNFSLSFLPVGGPYTVSVRAPGDVTESVDNVYLVLSETTSVSVDLVSSSSSVEEVVVTASRSEGTIRIGTGTTLDRNAMDGIPTVNRSVADFANLTLGFPSILGVLEVQKYLSWVKITDSMTLRLTALVLMTHLV
jgi:hypothetical protein